MHTDPHDVPLFLNNNGQDVFYRQWKIAGKVKGVVVIIHGFNSHSGYYHDFAKGLNAAGFDVYAPDLPGRGRSEGERYYIGDYHNILLVIDQLVNLAARSQPGLPLFIYGHSAGGVFASLYAAGHAQKLDGLVSSGFAFKIPAPGFALAFLSFLGSVAPHIRVLQLKNTDFSRDPTVVARMDNDPLIRGEKQPARTIRELLRASAELKKMIPSITFPLLVLHGAADKATDPAGSRYFIHHAASADKELKIYEGHVHDLLNDYSRAVVVNDIIAWLNQRA